MRKTIILYIIICIISYSLGFVTSKKHYFPYEIIMSIVHRQETDTRSYDSIRYDIRKSFFETHGINADNVMIGDSLIAGAEWSELFPRVSIVNRGISGDTTAGLLTRMDSIVTTKAKRAFILIGINDLIANKEVEEISANYILMIKHLKSNNIIPYILSTLLTNGSVIVNSKVTELNMRLIRICDENDVTYIDLNKLLANQGMLDINYTIDGVHLNGHGYMVLKSAIHPYIYKVCEEN